MRLELRLASSPVSPLSLSLIWEHTLTPGGEVVWFSVAVCYIGMCLMLVENVGFGVQVPELRSGLYDPGQVTVSFLPSEMW